MVITLKKCNKCKHIKRRSKIDRSMAYDEYEDEEIAKLKKEENFEDKVDSDGMEANEAAFLQGYEEDEDKTFEGNSEEE